MKIVPSTTAQKISASAKNQCECEITARRQENKREVDDSLKIKHMLYEHMLIVQLLEQGA